MTRALPGVYESIGGYRIERVIANGGQAMVYEVRDWLERPWALKVYKPGPLNEGHIRRRAEREAREVSLRLGSAARRAHLVIGEEYGAWGNLSYVKMKLLRGETLAERLTREGQLPINDALSMGINLAEALAAAHRESVLHRDLKPDNVYLDNSGCAHVLDWGSLQILEEHQTKTAKRYGAACTVGYAPIEQYTAQLRRKLTPAADLYALGVILYEALAGYHPLLSWHRGETCAPPLNATLVERALSFARGGTFRNAPTLRREYVEASPWACAQPREAIRLRPSLQQLFVLQSLGAPRPLPDLSRELNRLLRQLLAPFAADRPQSGTHVSMVLRKALADLDDTRRYVCGSAHVNARYVNRRLVWQKALQRVGLGAV